MPEVESARWNVVTRVAFRFAFSYLVLYLLPFPLQSISAVGDAVSGLYRSMWQTIVSAVAQRFFGITITVFFSGSGDKTYDYIRLLIMVVIAAAIALIWSILDRRRLNYTRLHEWLRVYVRFALLVAMVSYGAYKVIPAQFGIAPSLDRLVERIGDASPMGLLWTLMAASVPYQIFSGLGEMIGGLLLATRRTTLLGALITIAVMANVVALNFCYDVPVKLYSAHLLAMAVFLVLPDARRLLQSLIQHQPPLTEVRWLRIGGLVLRTVFVLFIVLSMLQESNESRIEEAFRHPLRGIWDVDTLAIDGVEQPMTGGTRWRHLVFDSPETLYLSTMNDTRERYWAKLDEKNETMKMTQRQAEKKKSGTLAYRRPDSRSLVLDGMLSGQTYHVTLHREDEPSFLLTTRGFHWINEYPFNR
jgi:hypothetical protein